MLGSTIRSAGELYLYTGVLAAAGLVGLGPVPMGVLISRWFSASATTSWGRTAWSSSRPSCSALGSACFWLAARRAP
jgi:hypothetical protein